MTILAIVPGKPKMCLQDNLVDCADCGGVFIFQPPSPDVSKYGNDLCFVFRANSMVYHCTGSVLNTRIVLTAAHCVCKHGKSHTG